MKALVAMSGGVDSAVSAVLMKKQGYEVTGVTMKLWGGDSDTGCCSISDVTDARRVADKLGIDHFVFNFGKEFDREVVGQYTDSHSAGETPNPCIECNRHIKFDRLLKRSLELGFDVLATGHHARIVELDGKSHVARAADDKKDQSYVLHMLKDAQLRHLKMPIGNMPKSEVREIARAEGFGVADKTDSYEVCFITKKEGRQKFLDKKIEWTAGDVVNTEGKVLGRSDSLELLTIGQRRNLGVQSQKSPVFVLEKDMEKGKVVVGTREELKCSRQPFRNLDWRVSPMDAPLEIQCSAHGKVHSGAVGQNHILWNCPQYRIAPGQSLVFYRENVVVGSATATAI